GVVLMAQPDILLTMSQVRAWERRLEELEQAAAALVEERNDVLRRLQAARIFMPAATDIEEAGTAAPEPESPSRSATEENLSEAALEAVRHLDGAPMPMQIRKCIQRLNPALGAKIEASPNYLYTVLLRHVRRGRLIKYGSGYK